MKRSFDRLDLYSAFGLFAVVAAWAFVWAYPYPHPDLWPFLVGLQWKVGPAALRAAGCLELGAFAAFVYLDLRGLWFTYRHEFDDLPDEFCFTRTAPICGAALFSLLPYSWRSAQSLSLGFALFVLILIGFFLWFFGRGGRSSRAYSLSFLLFGFVSGMNPLGFVPLVFAVSSDIVFRRNYIHEFAERDYDIIAPQKMFSEVWFSFLAGTLGFIVGACLLASKAAFWLTAWMGVAVRSAFSPATFAIVPSVLVAVIGIAIGRRIRSLGPYGLMMCRVSSGLLALAAFAMFPLAVDRPTRNRLQAIGEYASIVADDVRGVKFLFTDGRLDEVLRMEFAARGVDTVILNATAVPTKKESAILNTLAPEPGDRAVFGEGGAEVFKAWARERPDRLAESAWQLDRGMVRRYGQLEQRTHGSVMRGVDETRVAEDEAADARFAEWTRRVGAIAAESPGIWMFFGEKDKAVTAKFEEVLRRARGEEVERMLSAEKLVLTSREALEIALKREDFGLARRYAEEVLAGAPDDPSANFALGMANLESKDYFRAAVYFEKSLRKNPNEPMALNNLAIAYMKLRKGEKALGLAERAAEILPKSAEIQRTLAEIRKSVSKE